MTLYFIVRHGETAAFRNRILQLEEEPLNEIGIEQAKKLGERLKSERFDAILCSDSARARQTCEHIHKHHKHLKVEYLPELRERDWGVFKGTHFSVSQKFVEAAGLARELYRPEGGENFDDVAKRAKQAWQLITNKCSKHSNVLIVGHGTFNCFLISAAQKIDDREHVLRLRDKQIIPTTLNILESDGKSARIVCIGDTSHLGNLKATEVILEK